MSICVILPRLPPSIDGVGDYTLRLWIELCGSPNQEPSLTQRAGWSFLCHDGAAQTKQLFPEASVDSLQKNERLLLAQLEAGGYSKVLLQFVGYGFAETGAPEYLARALDTWKSRNPTRKLFVMFHELYASGPIWRRTFWTSFKQKQVAHRLLRLSNVSVVSNMRAFKLLKPFAGTTELKLIPIGTAFSGTRQSEKNFRHTLIFGLDRTSVLNDHSRLISLLGTHGLIQQIVLAGKYSNSHEEDDEREIIRSLLGDVSVVVEKNLPRSDIPETVQNCGLSLSHVSSVYLPKSSRFHLSCSIGQITIAKRSKDTPEEPLSEGFNYLCYTQPEELLPWLTNAPLLESIANESYQLSQEYFSWHQIALQWRKILQD